MDVIFYLDIDWGSGINEKYSFLTDIFKSYNGTEQRTQLRKIPRISIDYSYISFGQQAIDLETLVYNAQNKNNKVYVPVWTNEKHVLSFLPTGSQEITVNNVNGIVPSSILMIIEGDKFEKFTVEDAFDDWDNGTGTIRIFGSLNNSYSKEATVIPLLEAIITNTQPIADKTRNISLATVSFTIL